MSWDLNSAQKAVLRVYGGGDYRWWVDGTEDSYADGLNESGELLSAGEPAPTWDSADEFDEWCVEQAGDTLLVFLMRELGTDCDDDAREAERRVRTAIEELETVLVPLAML